MKPEEINKIYDINPELHQSVERAIQRNRSIITIHAHKPSAYCGGFVLCQGGDY